MEIDRTCFNCKGRKEAPRDGCTRTWHTTNRGPTQQYRRLWEAEDPEDINEQDQMYQTGDGYRWHYMYSVDQFTVDHYATGASFPLRSNASVTAEAVAGPYDVIVFTRHVAAKVSDKCLHNITENQDALQQVVDPDGDREGHDDLSGGLV